MKFNLPKEWSDLPHIDFSYKSSENTLHIFKVNLKAYQQQVSFFENLLDKDEKARSQRFISRPFENNDRVQPRHSFVISRGVLKQLLAAFLNLNPMDLHFSYTSEGKPFLDPHHYKSCFFNISHSQQITLIALSKNQEVGIDVEYKKPKIDVASLAMRMFSTQEQKFLFNFPEKEQNDMFYHLWSRKEALVKVDGQGIFQNFSALELPTHLQLNSPVNFELNQEKDLWLWDLPLIPEYSAAVAWRGTIKDMVCFTLSNSFKD